MSAARNALGWLRSVLVTNPLICLYTIVMGTISVASSLVDPRGAFQHRCAQIWSRMILATGRVRVRVRGWENVEPGHAYIFCANHMSLIDTPVIFGKLPVQFTILAKKSLFRIPFMGWHLRRSGHLPVDYENPRAARRSFEQAAQKLRTGSSLFFFPEGGRSRDLRLRPFRAGPFLLAIKAGVPVVPVVILGTREVLPIGSINIRPGQVEVVVKQPIPTAGTTRKDADRLATEVREQIARSLPGEGADEAGHGLSVVSAGEAEG